MSLHNFERFRSFEERERSPALINEFFNANAADLEPFQDAILNSPHNRVIINVHPYFLEENRYATKPGVREYNKMRDHYIFRAAEAGRPVLIFEEDSVINDDIEFESKYESLAQLPNVLFVRTMTADPTPYNETSLRLSIARKMLAAQFPYNKPWTSDDVVFFTSLIEEIGLEAPHIPVGEKLSLSELVSARRILFKADVQHSHRMFDTIGSQLRQLGVSRVSLGGAKYHHIMQDSDSQRGCLSFTATELHRLRFRVHISNYFSYPEKPSSEIQSKLRGPFVS
jgi:hypothetical protein